VHAIAHKSMFSITYWKLCKYSSLLLGPFSLMQVSHIARGTSGKGWGVAKCILFLVKVIVQGQGQQDTFPKKVKLETSTRDTEL